MDAPAKVLVRLAWTAGPRAGSTRGGIEPCLQIEEAALDHWEILLGDAKAVMPECVDAG